MPWNIVKPVKSGCLAFALMLPVLAGGDAVAAAPTGCVTRLDYLVFASLADSGNWVGFSTFRDEERTGWRLTPAPRPQRVAFVEDGAVGGCRARAAAVSQSS